MCNLEIWYRKGNLFQSSVVFLILKDNHLRLGHEVETSKIRKVSSEIDRSEITDLFSDFRERILQSFSTKLDFRKCIKHV